MPPNDQIVSQTILVAGQQLDDTYEVVSIDVEREVNRIPTASLILGAQDGDEPQQALLSGGPFAPGTDVEVKLHQGDTDTTIFKGVVSGLGVRSHGGRPELEVTLKDAAIGLVGARHNRIFTNKSDADAISDVVSATSTLTMGDAPSTQPAHEILVQYDASDWDFILTRADAQGLIATVTDGIVALHQIALSGSSTRTFSLALGDIQDMRFDLDVTQQRSSFAGTAWDASNLAPADPAAGTATSVSQGGSDVSSASDALSLGDEQLVHMVPMQPPEAQNWATARIARSRFALVRGRIGVSGMADLALMEIATLQGLGDRFNGDALVTGIRHRVDSRGFTTDIQFGLSPESFGRTPDIADPPARGLLPPISGLQLAIVTGSDADPDNAARVQVKVPAIAADPQQDLWARIATPDAGDGHGICFFPEVNDEVVVGFLADDPRYPIILGRLHGSKFPPPNGFTDAKQKGIVTKSGIKITMKEADNPSVTIETKGGRTFTLDDDGKKVTLADQDGNTVSFDSNGVSIKSAADLKIEASGSIKIKGASIDLN